MNIKLIKKELEKYIDLKNVLFITAQFTDTSYDIYIYCVVKDAEKSQVHIYKKDCWIEIFIDKWSDMVQKIKNYDEIAVGFIERMNFVETLSDKGSYKKAKKLIKRKYSLPIKRRSLLQYRIKVLSSKYFSATTNASKRFFIGQLMPHLIMAIFNKYGIWPHSPKKWIEQMKGLKKPESKQIINIIENNAKADNLITTLTYGFKGLRQLKDKNNKITYLG